MAALIVLGDLGLTPTSARHDEPARLYVGDFFNTGRLTQILVLSPHRYPLAEP
jgi:hypothetical protein